MKVCRPDIVLLSDSNMVLTVIEIVVTHEPEVNALEYYHNNIVLIQINLVSDEDIYTLDNKVFNPTRVTICFNPKCKICGNYQQKHVMKIIDIPCEMCKEIMKISIISSKVEENIILPKYFTDEEINIAKSKGVQFRSDSVVCRCPKCHISAKLDSWSFMFFQYILPANRGELFFEVFDVGYHCTLCRKT